MTMKEKFTKFVNWFESLFMTNHSCVSCGKEIVDGTKFQICDDCLKNIEIIDGSVCEKCGDKVVAGNKLCNHCKNTDYNFDCNRSFCYYSDVSSRIVKGLKYGKKKYFAKHIAEMMTELDDVFEDVDVITFVPVDAKRRKERGFNQAEEIAKELSRLKNICVKNTLIKLASSKHQAGLTQKERLENLKGSFVLIDEAKECVKDKVVLIVDDVFTTGATLFECSKTLKKAKPAKIKTITFAKTKFDY